jgi:hypothetical protein
VVILAAVGTTDEIYFDVSRFKAERMKSVVEALNERLVPVRRLVGLPPPDPMNEEELGRLARSLPSPPPRPTGPGGSRKAD